MIGDKLPLSKPGERLPGRENRTPTCVPRESSEGMVIWFTGLPCSGKTTLSQQVYDYLESNGLRVEHLDGDSLRQGLCKDLGFSRVDREENIRRIGYVAGLLARHGVIVLVAVIAPYRNLRDEIRKQTVNFVEVFVNAPLSVCEERDVKGLYKKARRGQIKEVTGVDDPYEPPLEPEVECHTDMETVQESSNKVIRYIASRFVFLPGA